MVVAMHSMPEWLPRQPCILVQGGSGTSGTAAALAQGLAQGGGTSQAVAQATAQAYSKNPDAVAEAAAQALAQVCWWVAASIQCNICVHDVRYCME